MVKVLPTVPSSEGRENFPEAVPVIAEIPLALLSSLVGVFHGHAHCQLCQLENLATYINGLGLEDLETCERTFSKSNALATMTRHASMFH